MGKQIKKSKTPAVKRPKLIGNLRLMLNREHTVVKAYSDGTARLPNGDRIVLTEGQLAIARILNDTKSLKVQTQKKKR
jgi:hypothetical protein